MDKWEQVAEQITTDWDDEDILKWTALKGMIAQALCQCEADTILRCAAVCDEQEQDFLSPEYAVGQPLSSLNERFACRQVKDAILALLPEEVGDE